MDNIAAVPISTIAREVQDNSPAKVVPVVASKPNSEPFSMYKDINQIPYTAAHFGISKSQYFALQQADITDLSPKIDAIENAIKIKILTEQYTDSTDTFKEIIEEASNALGIKNYESQASKIEKLFLYFNNGKGLDKTYRIKRSSKAEEIDQAKHRAMKQLNQNYPNKTSRLINFTKFF